MPTQSSQPHDHDLESHNEAAHDDHGSHAGHDHGHAPTDFGRAFAVGTALNAAFVALEAIYGF